MGLTLQIVALLAFSNLSLIAAQNSQYGLCVTNCFTTSAVNSWCDGDETGAALDQCRCASLSGSGNPLIACIQACPEDQQLPYARNLPSLCSATLFPNLDLSSSSSIGPSSTTQSATSSASDSEATSITASNTAGTSSTNTAAATGTSTTPDNGEIRIGTSIRDLLPIAAGIAFLNLI